LPHGILHVFNTILYENEFQNPQILMDTLEITFSCLTLAPKPKTKAIFPLKSI
jgi:hypothetical protein